GELVTARVRAQREVIPPMTGGLHCGPLSHFEPVETTLVIPPMTGGLHGGNKDAALTGGAGHVIPPMTGGLHCGSLPTPTWHPGHAGHPAHDGRAPLRLHGGAAVKTQHRVVIPPMTGGLH